ncbi:MAG: hypothetical protein ABJA67_06515, partial [Chthonomonadales bacterium]
MSFSISPNAIIKGQSFVAGASQKYASLNAHIVFISTGFEEHGDDYIITFPPGITSGSSNTITIPLNAVLTYPATLPITPRFNGTDYNSLVAQLIIYDSPRDKTPGTLPFGVPVQQQLICQGSVQVSIDAKTGNVQSTKTDPVATRGYPLINNIHVNSQVVEASRSMANATFTYDAHITTQTVYNSSGVGSTHWMLVDGDGSRLDFGPTSSNPSPTKGIFSQLTVVAGGYLLSNAGPLEGLDSAGNFTYAFNSNGQLTQIKDPAGNIQNLAYNGTGQLSTVIDVNTGKAMTFITTAGLITQVVSADGTTKSNVTYASGRLASIAVFNTIGTATSVAYTYSNDGTLASITRDNDNSTTINFGYTPAAANGGGVVQLSNGAGPDPVAITHIDYLAHSSSGISDTRTITNSRGGVTKYEYDSAGMLFAVTEPQLYGATQPTVTRFYYNANGQVTSTTVNGVQTDVTTYYANGLASSYTDANSLTWSWTFSGVDLLTAQDPLSHVISAAYADPLQVHIATSVTNPNSETSSVTHNAYGQTVVIAPPPGSPTSSVTITYDETAFSPTLGYAKSVLDGNGNLVTFDNYDGLGDITQISTYPINGNTTTRNIFGFTYDAAQRLTSAILPDGKTEEYHYVGEKLHHTIDAAGAQFNYNYCAVCGMLEGIAGPLGWSLAFGMDNDHNLTSFTDARGKITAYAYGLGGELKSVTYPDNTAISYLYDNKGRVRQGANGRGQTVTPNYDNTDRVSSVNFSASGESSVYYYYNNDGTVNYFIDGIGTTYYTYDASARVTRVVNDYTASGLAPFQLIEYSYNPDGSRHTMKWTNGESVIGTWTYNYDAGGRLTSIINPYNETTTWIYDGEGKIKRQNNNNSTYTTYEYNEARGWPITITHTRPENVMARYQLTYDNGFNTVGNLTGVTEIDDSTVQYGY